MPRAEDLPEDLKELAFRNGVELTHARWDSDVQVLVKALRPYVQAKQEPTRPSPPSAPSEPGPTRKGSSRMIIAALVSVLVLASGAYVWYQKSSSLSLEDIIFDAEGTLRKDKVKDLMKRCWPYAGVPETTRLTEFMNNPEFEPHRKKVLECAN